MADYLVVSPFYLTAVVDGGDAGPQYAYGGRLDVVSAKTGKVLQHLDGATTVKPRDALGGTVAFDPKTKTLFAASEQGTRQLVVAYRAVPKP